MITAKYDLLQILYAEKPQHSGQLFQRVINDLEANAITAETALDWLALGALVSGSLKIKSTTQIERIV